MNYSQKYTGLFDTMVIKPEKLAIVDAAVTKINAGKNQYLQIEAHTGVPWFVVGLIHYMEAGCNFSRHLHNGDPLNARTVQVPKGLPKQGNPPFSFFESAVDAIRYQKLDSVKDWSVGNILKLLEDFNGRGYRNMGVPSPYLWSFSNHYIKGKYVADHIYNPEAVSKQAGVAVIMRRVMEKNNLLKTAAGFGAAVVFFISAVFFFNNK